MLKITNSFHRTSTTIRMSAEDLALLVSAAETDDTAARKQLRRIKRRLCASPSCTCSGLTGER